jgi:hypothetical protein
MVSQTAKAAARPHQATVSKETVTGGTPGSLFPSLGRHRFHGRFACARKIGSVFPLNPALRLPAWEGQMPLPFDG